MPAPRSSATISSSPRPKANPRNTPAQSSVSSSPRPVSRSTAPTAKAPGSLASTGRYNSNIEDTSDDNRTPPKPRPIVPTTANPGQPPQQQGPGDPITGPKEPGPAPGVNPNLPADSVQASRGERRPDRTLIDALQQPGASRKAEKYRGTVLSAVYRMPADPSKAAQTLQQFNGPRGSRMTLGA